MLKNTAETGWFRLVRSGLELDQSSHVLNQNWSGIRGPQALLQTSIPHSSQQATHIISFLNVHPVDISLSTEATERSRQIHKLMSCC